jgi:hypothetical protein
MDKPDIRLLVGKTGSGKTSKALRLVEDRTRLIMFDTTGHDYSDGVVFYDLPSLTAFWQRVYRRSFRLIYRPMDPRREFEEICRLAFLCQDVTVIAEELTSLCDAQTIGPELRKLIMRGRHVDVTFIGLMQRPKGIHRDITSQASEIYMFIVDEPGDVKYFSDRLPGREIEERIKGLTEYQYLQWRQHVPGLVIGKDQL